MERMETITGAYSGNIAKAMIDALLPPMGFNTIIDFIKHVRESQPEICLHIQLLYPEDTGIEVAQVSSYTTADLMNTLIECGARPIEEINETNPDTLGKYKDITPEEVLYLVTTAGHGLSVPVYKLMHDSANITPLKFIDFLLEHTKLTMGSRGVAIRSTLMTLIIMHWEALTVHQRHEVISRIVMTGSAVEILLANLYFAETVNVDEHLSALSTEALSIYDADGESMSDIFLRSVEVNKLFHIALSEIGIPSRHTPPSFYHKDGVVSS